MNRLMLIISFILAALTPAAADGPTEKLGRGVTNIVTAPVEVPKEIRRYWIAGSEKTFHISAWLLCGAVKGLVTVPARMVSGVWDIATFPLALPEDYTPILKPDYVFDNWPEREPGVKYKNFGEK